MRRKARVDVNQPELVEAARAVGATVQHIHTIGKGCPDIIVGFRGANYLIEIKDEGGTLTPDEQDWHDEWKGQASIAKTADELLEIIGAI